MCVGASINWLTNVSTTAIRVRRRRVGDDIHDLLSLGLVMDFRLHYRGPLKSNGSPKHKQEIRRSLHPQLRRLWQRPPLNDHALLFLNREAAGSFDSLLQRVGPFMFASLVSSKIGLTAEIDVLFLRHQAPGEIVSQGGDIDNRLKTLFDALAVPNLDQIKGDSPRADEDPFHCLLENDVLITRIQVTTDQWLEETGPDDVILILHVSVQHRAASPVLWSWTGPK
jgi:hypothetical protein